jgi:hypothetical protein
MTEIIPGSIGVSKESHTLLKRLVYDGNKPSEDRPFQSLVDAFRFAFALGYKNNHQIDDSKKTESISARQFIVGEYKYLLYDELIIKNKSIGGLISEYAEGGCFLISKHLEENQDINALID